MVIHLEYSSVDVSIPNAGSTPSPRSFPLGKPCVRSLSLYHISGFCPQILPGVAGLGASCQRGMYFGEMKVGLQESKKGNESSWLCWFFTPSPPGCCLQAPSRPSVWASRPVVCVWHVLSVRQTSVWEPQPGNTRMRV